MSNAVPNKKKKFAKYAGCIYFIVLGLLNIIMTAYNGQHLTWKDFLVLVLFCSPLLVNKKAFYLLFGFAATLLSGYILLAIFTFHVAYVRGAENYTNPYMSAGMAYAVAYLFATASVFFSLCIIYAGLSDTPRSNAVT